MSQFDFTQRPFLAIWETTKACDLACVHCRASADPVVSPEELNTEEAKDLINQVHDMGTPILIFSGGDCLKRPDLEELIAYGKKLRLRIGAIPAVTPLLTVERLSGLKKAGLDQVAFSLDASTPELHDSFRRTAGVFKKTLSAIKAANQIGLPVQVNSLINLHNTFQWDDLLDLIQDLGVVFWEVFFLVPVGRGSELPIISADMFEKAFEKLYKLTQRVNFIIKITEAPHYRRFFIEQEMKKLGLDPTSDGAWSTLPEYMRRPHGPNGSIGLASQGVNSGKGFLFVSHKGEVYPSGFLPIAAGNVRRYPLKEIYRNSPLFTRLRDSSLLKGRCGKCPYKEICGGSRSRAWAITGDYLAEDPCCAYEPAPARQEALS